MKVLITAGPTREPIDPVRFLTNRSSGRMGYALAEAFARREEQVLLISGPTQLDIPDHVDFIPVETAQEMYDAVAHYLPKMDAAIFCAAVADYTPVTVAAQKIKKSADTLTLELKKTPDILGSARQVIGFQGYLVGFAAETEDLEQNARTKLERKGCDMIIANNVSRAGIGFDSAENEVLIVEAAENTALPRDTKEHLAQHLADIISERWLRKHGTMS
ncbi:MAG TPA: bifunctional phosphopantothenoylcysteine decarboxylase/phosphopantothenate--cysteine ligase CoaBC [Verrucomicrobiales bacterium]|nr:bifunctional phosphopantothenoylcysteine decarboxylase/phosphopantothenate--cysteine ligase CoaBC [Verrucomicrobiales bacterium]